MYVRTFAFFLIITVFWVEMCFLWKFCTHKRSSHFSPRQMMAILQKQPHESAIFFLNIVHFSARIITLCGLTFPVALGALLFRPITNGYFIMKFIQKMFFQIANKNKVLICFFKNFFAFCKYTEYTWKLEIKKLWIKNLIELKQCTKLI